MQRLDIEPLDRRLKWWLLGVSLLTLLALLAAALRENTLADWRLIRGDYAELLQEKATDERGRAIADQFGVHLAQVVLPELGRVDRCLTCHAGVDDPRMADQPQPFTTHPGKYLQIHQPAQFGCTICHQGQGRATETVDAHGRAPYWDYPLLDQKLMHTTCTRCHSGEDLYAADGLLARADGENAVRPGAELIGRGRRLARDRGCFGCHALGGKGGILGPDITFVGDKTRHQFDFSHLDKDAPRQVAHWLKKHFLDPATVTPGTVMPDLDLSEDEADALTAYMFTLRSKVVPASYHPPSSVETIGAEPPAGAELYAMYCSACHGRDGQVSEVPQIRTPSLNNVDFLAVASDDFLRFITERGRSGLDMPAWGAGTGNLARVEIDSIVAHIRGWEAAGAPIGDVKTSLGDPDKGKAYYQGLCANCHGDRGEGGIGTSLNSPTFLAIASDSFLAEAIIHGRPGTAMASWRHLPAQAVSDILAYIRQWQTAPPTFAAVQADRKANPVSSGIRIGEQLYQASCGGCHGTLGEGGIGPRLNSPDVLRAVDDRYLYTAITAGRPTTAMPAWSHLSAADVGAILTYLRSWQTSPALALERLAPTGDYALGKVQYELSCQGCHGEQGRGGTGPQLANPVFLRSISDAVLFHWIGRGRQGTAMKGFLAEEQGPVRLLPNQIADVIAYIRYLGTRDERPIQRTAVGDPHVGAQLYAGNCASCHGVNGEGASGPQLNNPTFLASASDGFLTATLVLGRTGTAMRSMLKGSEGLAQIPPEQLQDLIAYIRLWDAPQTWRLPRPVAEMSKRAIDAGRESYGRYCAACHGEQGGGKREGIAYFGPALNNPEFLQAASDGFLLATTARGRSNTPMRPFGAATEGIVALEPEEIGDIVSFIRTWQERFPHREGVLP